MDMKTMMRYVLIFVVSLVVLTGCGSSSSSGGDGNGSAPVVEQNSSIADDTNNTTPISNTNKVHQKSFSYDSTNRVVKEDLGDGKYIEYVYDDSGNLISQTVVK